MGIEIHSERRFRCSLFCRFRFEAVPICRLNMSFKIGEACHVRIGPNILTSFGRLHDFKKTCVEPVSWEEQGSHEVYRKSVWNYVECLHGTVNEEKGCNPDTYSSNFYTSNEAICRDVFCNWTFTRVRAVEFVLVLFNTNIRDVEGCRLSDRSVGCSLDSRWPRLDIVLVSVWRM